ncbi:MAG: BamA/TamA family outer membrane protein [Archangiaceae bacterium]|nr:BamA/TamA family outer membrane protein [Archangiaceae bacterium]
MLLALHALACSSTEEKPDGPVIDSFKIDGAHELKQRELKKKILTTDSFLRWLPFFGKTEYFDQNAWTADQRRIERYYQAHGFYQAKVVKDEVVEKKPGLVALRLEVREGQPTHVARFEVQGLDGLEQRQRETVLYKLPSKKDAVFEEEDWDESQKLLTKRLQQLGYAGVTLEPRALVDVGNQTADLEVKANLGQRYKFGRVYVSDPDGKVNPRLISDQVESVISTEDWFTPDYLEEAQARVFKMGVFSAVKVSRAALDQQNHIVPITVDVREAPFTTWRVGGGLGGDPLRNEVRAQVLYENRNFLGGTRRLTLRARAGYAFLAGSQNSGFFAFLSAFRQDAGSQQGPFGRLTAEIEQPHFLHRALAVRLTLEPSYSIEPAYRAAGGSARPSLVWRPTSHVTASLSWDFSIYQLSGPVVLGSTTTQFVGCGLLCALQYFEEQISWDRRDDPLEPHNGTYFALTLQQGGNTLADGGFLFFNFFKFVPEGRGYLSFFDNRFTLAGRVRLGTMFSRAGSVPIPVRFFSGGNDMRGFSARRLAPYDVVPLTDCSDLALDAANKLTGVCPGNGEVLPVGGNTVFEAQVEFRWNVWELLTIATFMDVGYVTQGAISANLFTALNYAVGIGARLRTPIGPIRIDLAARLPFGAPLERAGVLRQHAVSRGCFFGLGAGQTDNYAGSPEGLCAFHVSVGEAF